MVIRFSLLCACFFLLVGCFDFFGKEEKYDGLSELLTKDGTNVKMVFDGLLIDASDYQELQGWEVNKIKLVSNHSFYFLKNRNGTLAQLQDWATQHYFFVNVDHNGTALVRSQKNLPVLTEAKLMNISDVSAYLLDAFRFTLPNKPPPLFEQDEEHNEAYFTRIVRIQLKQYSYQDLLDLGTLIDGLPISFSYAELDVSDSEGLSGEISLKMVGVNS